MINPYPAPLINGLREWVEVYHSTRGATIIIHGPNLTFTFGGKSGNILSSKLEMERLIDVSLTQIPNRHEYFKGLEERILRKLT